MKTFSSTVGFAFLEFYQPQDASRWMEQHKVCYLFFVTTLGLCVCVQIYGVFHTFAYCMRAVGEYWL